MLYLPIDFNNRIVAGTIKRPDHFLRFFRKIIKCLEDELDQVIQKKKTKVLLKDKDKEQVDLREIVPYIISPL